MTPLRQRFIDDLRIRNYAPKSIKAYVAGVLRFARHFGRSPAELGAEHVRTFQLHLLQHQATWSTFNQTVCALRFLYRVTLGRPDVVSVIPFGKVPQTLPESFFARLGLVVTGRCCRPDADRWHGHRVFLIDGTGVSMSADAYAELPDAILVREVRVRVRTPGRRVRRLVLVTTLQDCVKYPARDLAKLYERRWRVEVDLRHLKITLGLDVLKSRTVAGVRKEVLLFGIAYNLVRRVMQAAARRQRMPSDRISFVDALRWLVHATPGEPLPDLVVVPDRPDRHQPRARKRRPKNYPLLNRPRHVLLLALKNKGDRR